MVKADLPDMKEKDIDIRVENKCSRSAASENLREGLRGQLPARRAHLRHVQPQFLAAEHGETEAIQAEYKNGVLTVNLPKREESKPRQVKVNVNVRANGKSANPASIQT